MIPLILAKMILLTIILMDGDNPCHSDDEG